MLVSLIVTPVAVYVSTLQSFKEVPTDPECDNAGPFNNSRTCAVPNRLTDGVLEDSSPVNFTQFSAWSRTITPNPRIYFQFSLPSTGASFYIRQIDLYFYRNAASRVGLPDVRLHVASVGSLHESDYFAVPYTISNQILDIDNQTVKVSLVESVNQSPESGYMNNIYVRLSFNFKNSDTLDWMLISEVIMFNETGECNNDHNHVMIMSE